MRLSVLDKYPQVYRLATLGPQNSVPSPPVVFVGLDPKQSFNPKIET